MKAAEKLLFTKLLDIVSRETREFLFCPPPLLTHILAKDTHLLQQELDFRREGREKVSMNRKQSTLLPLRLVVGTI